MFHALDALLCMGGLASLSWSLWDRRKRSGARAVPTAAPTTIPSAADGGTPMDNSGHPRRANLLTGAQRREMVLGRR